METINRRPVCSEVNKLIRLPAVKKPNITSQQEEVLAIEAEAARQRQADLDQLETEYFVACERQINLEVMISCMKKKIASLVKSLSSKEDELNRYNVDLYDIEERLMDSAQACLLRGEEVSITAQYLLKNRRNITPSQKIK